jgi:dihydroorotase
MPNTLITNAHLVNEGSVRIADVLVEKGRIARIDDTIAAEKGWEVLDADGRHLLPGMIDDQVHFREPGLTEKGDIAYESAAAVAGGITSYMDMPNVSPTTTTRTRLQEKYAMAGGRSCANFGFYLGATNDNLGEITALLPGEACGVKVFMGASTGNMLVDDPDTLEQIFARCPVPVVTHCEDTPTITANEKRLRKQYGDNVPISAHPLIRSTEACWKSSSLAVDLARRQQTRLHVLHLSTSKELELFSNQPLDRKRITVEACVHHLFFSDRDYASKGALIKCNPAIKTEQDRQALLRAVLDNRIDVIATDHAPHTWEEKQRSYFGAPAGLPLVQHALLSLLEQYHWGRFSLELIVQKTAHAPAHIFGVQERGFIREGYWADLVLVDLHSSYKVARDNVLYKCGWSPFEGYTFKSAIVATLVNGEIAYRDGAIQNRLCGQRLKFENFESR